MAEPFTLQLHITDRCQLQCRHCYRDARHNDLPLASLQQILQGFISFCQTRPIPGRLTIAGGEPLLRYDDLLALTAQAKAAALQVHLLTNGLLLTKDRIAQLHDAGVLRTQISIDGDETVHDSLRGTGTYTQTLAALHLLRDSSMWSTISMTLGQWNLHCLRHIIQLAREYHAKLFVSRYVPCGMGLSLQQQMLTQNQWRQAMATCRKLARKHKTGVALRDPLYVPLDEADPETTDCVGGCAIGYGGLAIDSDATAYPCRRLPLPLGNALHESFETLWAHPLLQQLRDRDRLHGACGACQWRWRCGGCRAIAYGTTNDPLAPDPQCSINQSPWTLRRLVPACIPRPKPPSREATAGNSQAFQRLENPPERQSRGRDT